MVCVLFRQNASWQGSEQWIEGAREESFRSVLELALLMDGALSSSEEKSEIVCHKIRIRHDTLTGASCLIFCGQIYGCFKINV